MENDVTPLQQIEYENNNETVLEDLERLSKKYKRYHQEHMHQNQKDPFFELLESKDEQINSLHKKLEILKQQLIDTTIIYNTKIEELRSEHRRELQRLHATFTTHKKNAEILSLN
jgi:hypothetical protein